MEINTEIIGDLLVGEINDLKKKYQWINDYVQLTYFCNEWPQFRDYYKWKFEYDNSNKNNKLKDIRKKYLELGSYEVVRKEYSSKYVYDNIVRNQKSFDALIKIIKEDLKKFNEIIELIYTYNLMSSDIKNKIKKEYKTEVCIYCNRQFISSWENDNNNKIITADLDHILPNSVFPLLALNINNLVPVCLVCNRFIKLDRVLSTWNPFTLGFNDNTYFSTENHQTVESIIGADTLFDIRLRVKKSLRKETEELLEKTIWFYKFNDLYSSHKEYVRTLLEKKHIYTPEIVDEIYGLINLKCESKRELELLLFGISKADEELDNKILGKLSKDILWN